MHRFAISYQRKKHNKNTFELELTKINGIGTKKAQKLIMYYKTKSALKNADKEELKKIAGVSQKTAEELYDFIQNL